MEELQAILEMLNREEAMMDLLEEDDRLLTQLQKENDALSWQIIQLTELNKLQEKQIIFLKEQSRKLQEQNRRLLNCKNESLSAEKKMSFDFISS